LTGLVDADQDIEAKLHSLKEVWDNMESQYLPQGITPKFHDYILERVS
jgi:sirohydrochlorin ferrochelatase